MPVVNLRRVENYLTRDGKEPFRDWLEKLVDHQTKVLIDKTIAKVKLGNLGKHKSVGQGVQEIKLNLGPGYRIYFGEYGKKLVILLNGSNKREQSKAIELAKGYWADWKERNKSEKESTERH